MHRSWEEGILRLVNSKAYIPLRKSMWESCHRYIDAYLCYTGPGKDANGKQYFAIGANTNSKEDKEMNCIVLRCIYCYLQNNTLFYLFFSIVKKAKIEHPVNERMGTIKMGVGAVGKMRMGIWNG